MSNRVITAFFDADDDANKAIIGLTEAGVPRPQIRKTPDNFDTTPTADGPQTEKGFWASLSDFLLPDEDRNTYAEAMKRGSIMVTATVDATHARKAEGILEQYGTVNLEERAEGWKKQGWTGYNGTDRTTEPVAPAPAKVSSTAYGKPSRSSASSAETDPVGMPAATSQAHDQSPSANGRSQGIDRPGFDLGGSSGDTHAGSGLGLGEDAFDTPDDRMLPGRRVDNDLTIPRWGGPEPRDTTASDKKTAGAEIPSRPETKKAR